MACRVGMTTNPSERQAYWKAKHPSMYGWTILARGLSYEEANRREQAERGSCAGEEGGRYVAGYVWSVYKFYY